MDLVAAYSHRIIALVGGQGAGRPAAGCASSPIRTDRDGDRQAAGTTDARGARSRRSTSRAAACCAGCRFEVEAGELVCLVGRNGAGKTTSFRTIMGFRKPVVRPIDFDGQRACVGLRPVRDRARWASALRRRRARCSASSRWPRTSRCRPGPRGTGAARTSAIADAYRVFPELERYRERGGQALSGGERKMVSIARALALGPKAASAR